MYFALWKTKTKNCTRTQCKFKRLKKSFGEEVGLPLESCCIIFCIQAIVICLSEQHYFQEGKQLFVFIVNGLEGRLGSKEKAS